MSGTGLRIALLSYRSKPHCGGQGVYVRQLSRELVRLGHQVEVFSGQPYPELDVDVVLTKVPSLDLYREPDPFRIPRPREFRDRIDVLEFLIMCTAGFPEPLTFSLRASRLLATRTADFDVVHDNQVLGSGLLRVQQLGLPVVGTMHHPITVDRRLDLAAAPLRKKLTVRRWYGFLRMQGRVVRQLDPVITVSESSLLDMVKDFGVDRSRLRLIPLGVDAELFRPPVDESSRVPGRLIALASADVPLKGLHVLLEAVAKLRTERADVHLTVVGRPTPGGPTERRMDDLLLHDAVTFVNGLAEEDLAALMRSAQVAVVPSLYEGFSFPAVEALACGTPLVASRAGAIPEVVGDTATLVDPGDAEQLAAAVGRLLDDAALRTRMGAAGRARVLERYTWRSVAEQTVEVYREAVRAAGGVCGSKTRAAGSC